MIKRNCDYEFLADYSFKSTEYSSIRYLIKMLEQQKVLGRKAIDEVVTCSR
jgi:hypothetical protein